LAARGPRTGHSSEGSSREERRRPRSAAGGTRMRLVLERARDRARSWYVLGVVVAIALVEGAGKRWM